MHVHGNFFVYGHGTFAKLFYLCNMAQNEKPTIMDIARLTGLSKGTVDRVLHNRGEVSKKSYEAVMKAIQELGYEPNVFASMLAKGGSHLIAVLMPEDAPGSFWHLAATGMNKSKDPLLTGGVKVEHFGYNPTDAESLRAAAEKMRDSNPSGVVIAPMFRTGTEMITSVLRELKIPYVFIDSKIDDSGYLAYFGMPMYRSGYLCADQLTGGRPVNNVLVVRIQRDLQGKSDPTVNRRAGFMDYMHEHCPDCVIHNIMIDPSDPVGIEKAMDEYFEANPDTHHIVMFNSRIHLLVPWLDKHPQRGRRVVGFDNLEANMQALSRGAVSVLICQHPDEQVAMAIQALSERIVLGKHPARRDNFMHMDILTRYNVDFY